MNPEAHHMSHFQHQNQSQIQGTSVEPPSRLVSTCRKRENVIYESKQDDRKSLTTIVVQKGMGWLNRSLVLGSILANMGWATQVGGYPGPIHFYIYYHNLALVLLLGLQSGAGLFYHFQTGNIWHQYNCQHFIIRCNMGVREVESSMII